MTHYSQFHVNNIILSKPKKTETTYLCNCYYQEKKTPVEFSIDNVYVISNAKNAVNIKAAKVIYNMFSAISNQIIATVKDNRSSWFSTTMPDELIDDYYSHPIIYDEKYGDLVRLKLHNSLEIGEDFEYTLKKRCTLKLTLNGIRIFKQKFCPEWTLVQVMEDEEDILCDEIEEEEDLDIPYEEIRKEYIKTIDEMTCTLKEHLERIQMFKEELLKAGPKTVIGICDRMDEFLTKSDLEE